MHALFVATIATVVALSAAATTETWSLGSLSMKSCLTSSVTGMFCVNVTTHVDHDGSMPGVYFKAAFGVRRATGIPASTPAANRNAVVYLLGGPGDIGHNNPLQYKQLASVFGTSYDVVSVDGRGIGWSCGSGCLGAVSKYLMSGFSFDLGKTAFVERAAAFDAECKAEINTNVAEAKAMSDECIVGYDGVSGSASLPAAVRSLTAAQQRTLMLPYLGTRQMVRDIENFRKLAGYSKIWIVGRSYGTVGAQAYAATFPNTTAGIVLDSPVDTTVSSADWINDLPDEVDKFVYRALELCAVTPECGIDYGFAPYGDGSETPRSAYAKISAAFSADGSAWPKTASTRYVDFASLKADIAALKKDMSSFDLVSAAATIADAVSEVRDPDEIVMSLTREALHFMAFAKSNEPMRAAMLRAMRQVIKLGDWTEMVRFALAKFVYVVDLRTLGVVDYYNFATSAVGSCPLITGRDYLGRYEDEDDSGSANVSQRAAQMYDRANATKVASSIGGAKYVWVPTAFTAFENPSGALYSPENQATDACVANPTQPGRTFPIVVATSDIDMQISAARARGLYERYGETGPAFLIEAINGKHVLVASSIRTDLYSCVDARISSIVSAAAAGTLGSISGASTCASSLVSNAIGTYWRHTSRGTSMSANLVRVLRELSMDVTFRTLSTPIVACRTGGIAVANPFTAVGATKAIGTIIGCSYFETASGVSVDIIDSPIINVVKGTTNSDLVGFDIEFPLGLGFRAGDSRASLWCFPGAKYNTTTGSFSGVCI